MGNKEYLKDHIGVVYFKYPDGSLVRTRCTASKEVYESLGGYFDIWGLYDVDIFKRVPDSYLELDCEVYTEETDVDKRNDLDKYMNPYIQSTW